MQCLYPMYAIQRPEGGRPWIAKYNQGEFGSPAPRHSDVYMMHNEGRLFLPCGKCMPCRLKRKREWGVRAWHENQLSNETCFITLTFDEENIPAGRTVHISDLQLFFKKLRKHFPPKTIRFFACGEYGAKTGRPHYHALIYGTDFPDKVRYAKSGDFWLYVSPFLNKVWSYGNVWIGDVTFDSAQYCAGYITKKITGDAADEHYATEEWVDNTTGEVSSVKRPEFATQSRMPGIGYDWFMTYKADLINRGYCTLNGVKISVPAYYKKLMTDDELEVYYSNLQTTDWREHPSWDYDELRQQQKDEVIKARMDFFKDIL